MDINTASYCIGTILWPTKEHYSYAYTNRQAVAERRQCRWSVFLESLVKGMCENKQIFVAAISSLSWAEVYQILNLTSSYILSIHYYERPVDIITEKYRNIKCMLEIYFVIKINYITKHTFLCSNYLKKYAIFSSITKYY